MGMGKSMEIVAGVDPEEGGALPDDPWSRNEESDLDKADSVSSSDKSNVFVFERGGSLAGSFCPRLLPAWQTDCVLPAVAGVDEDYADPE